MNYLNCTHCQVYFEIVRQTIKGIKDNPERGIRRLVDMAQEFSGGRFQKYFFTIAQTMLAEEFPDSVFLLFCHEDGLEAIFWRCLPKAFPA